VEINKQKKY